MKDSMFGLVLIAIWNKKQLILRSWGRQKARSSGSWKIFDQNDNWIIMIIMIIWWETVTLFLLPAFLLVQERPLGPSLGWSSIRVWRKANVRLFVKIHGTVSATLPPLLNNDQLTGPCKLGDPALTSSSSSGCDPGCQKLFENHHRDCFQKLPNGFYYLQCADEQRCPAWKCNFSAPSSVRNAKIIFPWQIRSRTSVNHVEV